MPRMNQKELIEALVKVSYVQVFVPTNRAGEAISVSVEKEAMMKTVVKLMPANTTMEARRRGDTLFIG